MLQIFLINQTESGFLDLSPDAQLSIEALSGAFDEDLTFGEFSLPLDIPFTGRNLRLLGFANRLKNNAAPSNNWIVNVYDDGFPELINAKMTLLVKTGDFNRQNGKFSVTISGTKGLFGSLILNKKLADLDLGKDITFTETSREYATALMKGMYAGTNLGFAPVAIENYFDTNRPDYINEFLAADTVNTVVVTDTGPDDWEFGRPVSPGVPADPGTSEYIDFRTVPFLNFKYLLSQVFKALGFTVSGALLNSLDFQNLYVFNTFSIDELSATLHTDANKKISYKNHVPDILIVDFLKCIFSLFKVFPVFSASNVYLKFKYELIENVQPFPFSKNCGAEYESTLQETLPDGYKLQYKWDDADGYHSDRVKDLTTFTKVGTVMLRTDLDTLDIGRAFTLNDYALVQAENLFYKVADLTTIPVLWDCFAENLDDYTVAGGERNVDLACSTLCQYVRLNSTTALYERQNYVGTRQPGSYINNVNVRVINPFAFRLFYLKKISIDGVNIPVTYNHNQQPDGTRIELYSLALNAISSGLAEKFHLSWENLKSKMEVVKMQIMGDRRSVNEFNDADKLEIESIHYLTQKVERTIPAESTLDVYLVPV